jgi:hypothetical protein
MHIMRNKLPSLNREKMTTHHKVLVGTICFLSFLLFYGITARSQPQVSDEVAMFASGVSLVKNGNLAIDEWQWLQDEFNIGSRGRGGHLYPKYFPGNIYASAFIYKMTAKQNDQPYLWHRQTLAPSNVGARMALKTNAVFGALAMTALLFLLLRTFDWRTTIATVLLTGICTNWWYQSHGFMSEVGAGAFMIAGLCFMAYQNPSFTSLSIGISILFRPTNLLALPIWVKSVFDKGARAIWTGIFILFGLIGLALFNWIRFASFSNFGYGSETFTPHLLEGLYGVLLSPGRSIFIYSPVIILAIPGALMLYKTDKAFALVCISTVLSYILMAALWDLWDGGWTWGSRLLTPIVPILGFLMAPVIDYAWGKREMIFVILIFSFLGLSIQLLALANDPAQAMIKYVTNGNIPYIDTLYTVKNSWIALQIRNLQNWNRCQIDAYTLHQWLGCR